MLFILRNKDSKEDHAFYPMEQEQGKKTTLFIPWDKNK